MSSDADTPGGRPGPPGGHARRAAPDGPCTDPIARRLGRASAAGIVAAFAIMLAVEAAGRSRAVVRTPQASLLPPWSASLHPSVRLVTIALWAAMILGGAAVAAGLMAVARGARPSPRLLLAGAMLVAVAFTVTPAAGSTDTLDYAAYGRMVAIGHDPYVMTPAALRRMGDPVGRAAPKVWSRKHSVYGPLATVEQAAAATLGGPSAARIVFWLKLWNGLAFAAVILALDRLLRADPARRVRAHLWWSVNPLMVWWLVAGGHIDALAAATGMLGLALIAVPGPALAIGQRGMGQRGMGRGHAGQGGGGRVDVSLVRAGAAGAMVGAAADMKITFVMYGLGIAWAARRSPRILAAAAAGAVAVLVPSYAWFGPPAVAVLLYRDASATTDNLYRFVARLFGLGHLPDLTLIAVAALVALAWLLLRRLPDGLPSLPAAAPALALSLAWLLTWPYQRPWYDAMAVCLLAAFPASRLDWPVLARLTAVSALYVPGMPGRLPGWLAAVSHEEHMLIIPAIRFAALAAVAALAATGAWQARQRTPASGPGSGAPVPGTARRAVAESPPQPE